MDFSNLMKIIIEMFVFAISLIQRWVSMYCQRLISLLRIFSTNWVEIPLSDKMRKSAQVDDPWKGDGSISKPKFISLPVYSDENNRSTKPTHENNELNSNREGSWINPRDKTSQFSSGNSRSLNQSILGPKFNFTKRKSFMSSTNIKLAEYDSINRDYLSQEDFIFSFTHPSAPDILNKSYLTSSSHCVFKQPRNFKRKLTSFKPTELSIIYENLAY